MPTDADRRAGQHRLRRFGQINDLRDVGEVVARKRDDVGPPRAEQPEKGAVALDLEIDQLHLVPGLLRRRGHQLQAERLQPQKYLCVHQRAGMDAEDFHPTFSRFRVVVRQGSSLRAS